MTRKSKVDRDDRRFAKQMEKDWDEADEDCYTKKMDLDNTAFFNESARSLRAKDPNKVYDRMRLKSLWGRELS